MSKEKRESAKTINEIQGKVQDIFFDLETFQDNDTAGAAQKKTIELMDAVDGIRNRILTNGKGDGTGD